MKLSGNIPSPFPSARQVSPLQNVRQQYAAETLSRTGGLAADHIPKAAGMENNPAAILTLSQEGFNQYHGMLSGKKPWESEELEKLKNEGIAIDEIPSYCSSINFGISLGRGLQALGQQYAQKYDEIIQNHGKGNRVVITDEQTGELRDSTLEEKLAVLDESFEYALDYENYLEGQRSLRVNRLEKQMEYYREIGDIDRADTTVERLEKLKNRPKLPDDFEKSMIAIREEFKKAYGTSSKDQAWESMLEAIEKLFKDED